MLAPVLEVRGGRAVVREVELDHPAVGAVVG